MWCPPSSRAAGREGARGSVRGRGPVGVRHFLGSHRGLAQSGSQPRPCPPNPSCPSFCPCPQAPTYVHGPGRGQRWGWEYPPLTQVGLMVRRPLISSGREIGPTTQPPIVGHPYLRKFRLPHPEEAAGPPRPRPHFSLPLRGWRAWQAWVTDHVGVDPCLPPLGGLAPPSLGHQAGRSTAGSGLGWVSEGGS